jgi:Flp pilus assembly protein TadB
LVERRDGAGRASLPLPWWRIPLAVVAVIAGVAFYFVGPRYGLLLPLVAFTAVMAICLIPMVVWRRRGRGR